MKMQVAAFRYPKFILPAILLVVALKLFGRSAVAHPLSGFNTDPDTNGGDQDVVKHDISCIEANIRSVMELEDKVAKVNPALDQKILRSDHDISSIKVDRRNILESEEVGKVTKVIPALNENKSDCSCPPSCSCSSPCTCAESESMSQFEQQCGSEAMYYTTKESDTCETVAAFFGEQNVALLLQHSHSNPLLNCNKPIPVGTVVCDNVQHKRSIKVHGHLGESGVRLRVGRAGSEKDSGVLGHVIDAALNELDSAARCENPSAGFISPVDETCDSLASRFGITREQIQSWNPFLDCEKDIWEGTFLCIDVQPV
ncbi:hypothetical protein D9758_010231 [Tetrapyrgos nigripes]|uniref:LysM domain-containing protein n=1 Tax=Tetrapyrgos nigripes TaxID=182062 RepID=A0A8H5CXK9_9AGAR|nr:hypothetical protein D9758_010231 [Tetrapyrgos nigripes]